MTLHIAREIMGWCTLLNVGLLIVSSAIAITARRQICRLHGNLFGINPSSCGVALYCFLGIYKVLLLVFNLVPYLALVIVTR